MELLAVSVGIGLVVGLLFTELFGIPPAGLVVPGYLALYLTRPLHLLVTLAIALATLGLVQLVSSFTLLHGRRRTGVMILVGYLLGLLAAQWAGSGGLPIEAIGFVIPGLLAVWMDRQTVPHTVCASFLVAFVVRLVLIVTIGTEVSQ